MAEKLFLFDGMVLAYRAYFAFISRPLTNPKGENVSAVYGFVSALLKVIEDEKPDHVVVAFDTKEPTFRHKEFPEYKAQRQSIPDDMIPQLQIIKDVVRAFNIQLIELPGWEADDVIGTLVKRAEREHIDSFMVTPDKDYCQLVTEHIRCYRPPRMGNEYEVLGVEGVIKKFGVPPEQVIEFLGLVGDTSDNIPGVKGVGEKTALPLIQKYGTIENIYAHLDEIEKPALRKKFEESREMALLSKKLVTIDTDAPVGVEVHQLKAARPNIPLLMKLFGELNFKSYVKKFEALENENKNAQEKENVLEFIHEKESSKDEIIDAPHTPDIPIEESAPPTDAIGTIHTVEHHYKVIQNEAGLDAMLAHLAKAERVSFDLETTSVNAMMAEIVGISFSVTPFEGYYIPVDEQSDASATRHELFDVGSKQSSQGSETADDGTKYSTLSTAFVVEKIKPLLESAGIPKIGQNIKYDALVMRNYGVDVAPITFDTMVAAFVIRPDGAHDMDSLAVQYLKYRPCRLAI